MWAGLASHLAGDGSAAVARGEEAIRIAREAKAPAPELFGLYSKGVGTLLAGATAAAIDLLEQALRLSDQLAYHAFRSEAHYGLALAHLARGDLDAATAACRHGLVAGEHKLAAEFRRILGEISARRGDHAAAASQWRKGLALAERQTATLFVNRLRALLATCPPPAGE
jgi:tetratricopeptide (TPR) repeat protein